MTSPSRPAPSPRPRGGTSEPSGPPLVRVCVPLHGPSMNDRLHPMARYRRTQALKESVQWDLKAQRTPAYHLERALLRVTLLYSTGRYRDTDNAISSCKAGVDALVTAGVLRDDSPDVVEWLPIVQQKSESGGRFTLLEVWPAEDVSAE